MDRIRMRDASNAVMRCVTCIWDFDTMEIIPCAEHAPEAGHAS